MAFHSPGYVAETDEQAREEFFPHQAYTHARIGRERGWGRLTRLLTAGNLRAVKGGCILRFDDLIDHLEDLSLIVLPSASTGPVTIVQRAGSCWYFAPNALSTSGVSVSGSTENETKCTASPRSRERSSRRAIFWVSSGHTVGHEVKMKFATQARPATSSRPNGCPS